MLKYKPQIMRMSMNTQSSVIYRKKPEPCKIVTLSSLNKTNSGTKKLVDDILVNFDGNISSDSWVPISTKSKNIEVSTTGWNGLITRYNKSKLEIIEVA
ncbi:MAG: hypothetical protein CMA53_00270 [Euryarchaeota archaeon]|nr:hypothetical protein [Euryarchaeota archaeon]